MFDYFKDMNTIIVTCTTLYTTLVMYKLYSVGFTKFMYMVITSKQLRTASDVSALLSMSVIKHVWLLTV